MPGRRVDALRDAQGQASKRRHPSVNGTMGTLENRRLLVHDEPE
jgi:hypothetical protein